MLDVGEFSLISRGLDAGRECVLAKTIVQIKKKRNIYKNIWEQNFKILPRQDITVHITNIISSVTFTCDKPLSSRFELMYASLKIPNCM